MTGPPGRSTPLGVDRLVTADGTEVLAGPLMPVEDDALFVAFRSVVAAGEGYPQHPDRPLDDAAIRDYWLAEKAAVVAARVDGRFVGSYFLKPNGVGRAAHVANAGYLVAPDQRGHGIGTALVEHSFGVARGLGFDALQFNFVFESNPARRLYERLGFREVGRVPEVIDGEDVLVLWRSLREG